MLVSDRPLHLAARYADLPELASLLLTHGADVDPQNSTQLTPLAVACKANNPAVASQLIQKGIASMRVFVGSIFVVSLSW